MQSRCFVLTVGLRLSAPPPGGYRWPGCHPSLSMGTLDGPQAVFPLPPPAALLFRGGPPNRRLIALAKANTMADPQADPIDRMGDLGTRKGGAPSYTTVPTERPCRNRADPYNQRI